MTPSVSYRPYRRMALGAAIVLAAVGTIGALVPNTARAQGAAAPPDDALLGTVEVDGSGDGVVPLPKLGFVPVAPSGDADRLAQGVVRHDLELSGQYDVLGLEKAPDPLATRESIVDLAAWRAKGAEVVVRIFASPRQDAMGTRTDIFGEAYETRGAAPGPAQSAPKPLFQTHELAVGMPDVRAASHRVTDAILGALTGRPGPFASHLVFSQRDGKWQSARTLDADGENPRTESPSDSTILSPVFGPGGVLYYVMSRDYAPFRIAAGRAGTFLPIDIPGSVLGIAISPEGTRAALTVMKDGKSTILTSENGRLSTLTAAPLAHHPAFGPLGKVAYVGGAPVQRVHVDGQAVSPAGFMASAPTFCDTSRGLWLVFTVEVAGGAELVATDSKGGNMRRLTQRQGENRYPACSPDGRLVAFFSTTKTGQGPGLYVMPTGRPWLAKRISSELGQSLRWERLPLKASLP
jgi:TolB protein